MLFVLRQGSKLSYGLSEFGVLTLSVRKVLSRCWTWAGILSFRIIFLFTVSTVRHPSVSAVFYVCLSVCLKSLVMTLYRSSLTVVLVQRFLCFCNFLFKCWTWAGMLQFRSRFPVFLLFLCLYSVVCKGVVVMVSCM